LEPKDFINGIPENLEPSTLFLDGSLFISAQDQIPEEAISHIDIAAISPDAVIISCEEDSGVFTMTLFYGDCCDNSIYHF